MNIRDAYNASAIALVNNEVASNKISEVNINETIINLTEYFI